MEILSNFQLAKHNMLRMDYGKKVNASGKCEGEVVKERRKGRRERMMGREREEQM